MRHPGKYALVILLVEVAIGSVLPGGAVAAGSGDRLASVASPDSFTDCVNGTSDAVVACGYEPGPTAIELGSQATDGETVTVRAVNLSEGGFVGVHTMRFVDGESVGSVLGTSGYLAPGLHQHITVDLDRPIETDCSLLAVVYRDSDDDRTYDFVESDGAVDRPYTKSYSKSTGHVNDEAGDVIGDIEAVAVERTDTSIAAAVAGDDGVIDTPELLSAIRWWAMNEPVPDTGGKHLDMRTVLDLIEHWKTGSPV